VNQQVAFGLIAVLALWGFVILLTAGER